MVYKENGVEYIKNLKEIREMLKEVNNKHWNEERTDLDLKYYVPTDMICEELEPFEIGIEKSVYDYIEKQEGKNWFSYYGITDYFEENGYEEIGNGDNTYNHCGRPQNDFNWQTFKKNDEYYVVMSFHLGGDIRGNYTDDIVLKFDYDTQFYEVLDDLLYRVVFEFEHNGKTYQLTPNVFDECLEVYDIETDDYIYGIYTDNDEDTHALLDEKLGITKRYECLNCGRDNVVKQDEISEDELGKHIICKHCGASFDID